MLLKNIIIFISLFLISTLYAQSKTYPLNSLTGLEFHNTKAEVVEYMGKTGIRVEQKDKSVFEEQMETLVLLTGTNFTNGTIEIELAGQPADWAPAAMRGFVGVTFKLKRTEPLMTYECIYLRPTNGRSENQLMRNHSVQYTSHPEYPWYKLRKENPGVYETYVDCEPGVWTKLKIIVSGETAKLFVHGNDQPTLIINDLKLGETGGEIALWMHSTTLAYYRNLTITPAQ